MRLDHLLSKESTVLVGCSACEPGPLVGWVSGSGLLFLFPHLIGRGPAVWWVCVGVAGWNASAAGSDRCPGWGVGLGTLLGPEETPVGVFSGPLWVLLSNAGMVVVLWSWWRWGIWVWLCVECCIVDASILVWSSV